LKRWVLATIGLLVVLVGSAGILYTQRQQTALSSQNPFIFVSATPVNGHEGCYYCEGDFSPSYGNFLAFNLTLRNGSEEPVYYYDMCGTSLCLSVTPSSAVVSAYTPYGLYSCPEGPRAMNPGETQSIFAPANSPTLLRLVQRGTFTANLTLIWWHTNGPQETATYLSTFTVR
jgi:hypothetical protein